ncbi:DUF3108 domain-containing protein [Lewinella sp. W8]|uniref:DUF3108 domain-containing protein n=1 Tax=Lewinella sp. W8 TaxID=2528208 RepID=UPI001068659F|nr:DUF3108 domain-containing protein [Lewinella sp. W8]MTB51948.1 DUF3108 domain-containing protein [Lewinella sp. W8]
MTTLLTRLSLLMALALTASLATSIAPATSPTAWLSPERTAPATSPNASTAPDFHPPMSLPDICDADNLTFKPGERIVYKIYYNWNFVWLPAAEVTFLVHDLPNYYHVMVRGETYSSYEWFYKAAYNYESYLDKETLLPNIHIKEVKEKTYSRYDRTTFYQKEGRAVSERGKTRDDLTEKTIPLEGCMHDLISIVYYARNLEYDEMKLNQEIPIEILMDQEVYPLNIKYLGPEEDKKVKGQGRYRTQKFSPQLIAGEVFKEGDEMQIWVSDDENKMPVLIESPVSVGSIKAVLKSYEGLRYPMTAKIE